MIKCLKVFGQKLDTLHTLILSKRPLIIAKMREKYPENDSHWLISRWLLGLSIY